MASKADLLLGVDLGAGSLKATVIDAEGHVLGQASAPIETRQPRPGRAEQDPAQWLEALRRAVPRAIERAAVAPGRLAALGLSAGAHIAVLTDRQGAVVRPAILWSDQRSTAEAAALEAEAGALILERAMNRVNPTWTLAQLAWLRRHEPAALARCDRLYLAKDYLRHSLTGDWHSDFSDAVGALLADRETGGWSAEICALVDWPSERLPPLAAPSDIVGRVAAAAAARLGLPEGLPVVCGSNDTTVELFGAGALAPGQGAVKLASAGVLFLTTEGASVRPPVSCYPHLVPGRYYAATGINSCATAHRWLCETFFSTAADGEPDYAAMDASAAAVPPGAEGLIFHPYLQGERAPHWDPRLRADFIGITLSHGRGHFLRALYEGIAFAFRDMLEAARAEGFVFEELRLIGGGGRSALWRQILADGLGMRLLRPETGDASFGAALVAGLGAGLYDGPEAAVAQAVRLAEPVLPDPERGALYDRLFALYRDAQVALAPLNHRLHDLNRE